MLATVNPSWSPSSSAVDTESAMDGIARGGVTGAAIVSSAGTMVCSAGGADGR